MAFNSTQVRQGNQLKRQAEETPLTATMGGATDSEGKKDLDYEYASRMAGPGGAFAIALSRDPSLRSQIDGWRDEWAFNTREGADFYGFNNEDNNDNSGVA